MSKDKCKPHFKQNRHNFFSLKISGLPKFYSLFAGFAMKQKATARSSWALWVYLDDSDSFIAFNLPYSSSEMLLSCATTKWNPQLHAFFLLLPLTLLTNVIYEQINANPLSQA